MSCIAYSRVALCAMVAACASSEPRPTKVQNTESPGASAGDALCDRLHPGERDQPGIVDAQLQCGRYRDEFLPDVAAKAVSCMEAAGWDVCKLSPCTTNALATHPREMDESCKKVALGCPGMDELCASHIAGMNSQGRQRFATCLVENCGRGVRSCLWDSMVTACD